VPKGRYTLESIEIRGEADVDEEDVEDQIASTPSPRFLGLFSGFIYDYQVFDRYVLERDLERIERYYRARGYYRARVRAAQVTLKGRGAHVRIRVEEGPPVLLVRVDLHGLESLPKDEARRIRETAASALPLQSPLEEESFEEARTLILRALADEGYAYARVRSSADVDLPKSFASAGFWIEPGPKSVFGEIRFEGLGPLPEPPVRRALDVRSGDPYSQDELEEAKRALLDLGVFSAVTIDPVLEANQDNTEPVRVPLIVRVERSKLRSVHLGGGVQADSVRTDLHLLAGWEDANFLGGFRKLVIEAVPGVVLYPTRLPSFEEPERLLPQGRLRTEFRQPGFLEARTNAVLRAQASAYPVLLSSARDPGIPVLGYRDLRASAGLERSRWKVYGMLSHNLQINNPFAYVGTLDPDLGTVLVSYPELFTTLDLRDDRVSPHKGVYVSMNTQVAGVGGDARDVKLQPEARAYIPLTKRVTLAARATVGFLFPSNYGGTVLRNARTGMPADADRAEWIRDIQLMFLRGFFSGGAGSNRGYALREIGPHGDVPFYNPSQTPAALAETCRSDNPDRPRAICDLPLGGFTLWEASLELRFPLTGPLSGAMFTDTSDVAAQRVKFRFNRPHLSVGFGLRYETPVGPVRLDLGYRIPGLQSPSSPEEGRPATLLGLPAAISFGIGEAF
jgi:outer membrane protein insertion porin family/translocation and assembly module TamA